MGLLSKFYSERGGPEHGGLLSWPGTIDGFPFRGANVPLLTPTEQEERIETVPDFHAKKFRLWIEEENKEYQEVMDRIVKGWYVKLYRHEHWVEQEQHLLIYLEWAQMYGELKHDRLDASAAAPGGGNRPGETSNRVSS